LIVGKQGENIKSFTHILKTRFQMENPQIEVAEVSNPHLDAQTMADYVVNTLERFGPKRFKSVGYKALQMIMDAGAKGAELHIGGRGVPSSRAHTWRFYSGYLKKCGDIATSHVPKAYGTANLKSGTVGIKVAIMLPEIGLPDRIDVKQPAKIAVEQVPQKEEEKKEEKAPKKERKPRVKKPKKEEKKEAPQEAKEESKSEPQENKEGEQNVEASKGTQEKEN
ncbi:30S ribosomal protein S3, partial [Candidatus Woesearchaeota archaeon]|nr:30S ribosomal protein S3 [Candidatus Woesearchaeota archaeon]